MASGATVRWLPIFLPESSMNFRVTAISPAFLGRRPSCTYGWSMPSVPISCMVADLPPSKSNVTSCDRSGCTFSTPSTARNAAISSSVNPAVDSTWMSCRPWASKNRSVPRNASRQPAYMPVSTATPSNVIMAIEMNLFHECVHIRNMSLTNAITASLIRPYTTHMSTRSHRSTAVGPRMVPSPLNTIKPKRQGHYGVESPGIARNHPNPPKPRHEQCTTNRQPSQFHNPPTVTTPIRDHNPPSCPKPSKPVRPNQPNRNEHRTIPRIT